MRALYTLLLVPALSYGANKEIVELQRDVSIMQDNVKTIQRTLDEKLAALDAKIQLSNERVERLNNTLLNLQSSIGGEVRSQNTQVSGTVANLGNKVDQVSTDMGALRETLADFASTLKKIQAQVNDIANAKTALPPPPVTGAPLSTPPGSGPGATNYGTTPAYGTPVATPSAPTSLTPPPGLRSMDLYNAALADLRSNKTDLAGQEFTDYLTYFGTTELAANAQYYLGEIAYNKQDFNGALNNFNLVLDKYPENPKRADAMYMVGQALLKQGQRNAAYQQFRKLAQSYPSRQDLIGKANAQVKEIGLTPISANSPSATPSPRTVRRRR